MVGLTEGRYRRGAADGRLLRRRWAGLSAGEAALDEARGMAQLQEETQPSISATSSWSSIRMSITETGLKTWHLQLR